MALNPIPIATKGAPHTAQMFRMMIRDLARGNQGITSGSHLKVTALATPGAGVQIADGSAVIAGKANPVQGHYNAYNIGTDTVNIASTGSTTRSDMVILRVLDPEYEGTRNPATDQIVFFDVISNVSSSATTVPAGYSAIPLARIDIPASTATITNAMIKDLRGIANPQRSTLQFQYFQSTLYELTKRDSAWYAWPAPANVSVPIPAWATSAKILWFVAGLRMSGGNVDGALTFKLGTKQAAQYVNIDDNQGTGLRRGTLVSADTISLTDTAGAAMRGTTQTLQSMMMLRNTASTGTIGADGATTFVAQVEFTEGPI
ncbi:hypothetical protein ACFC08_28345 [Streptomyces sp. NPDC056112]|uniref:hypothetical protein n=1 Tax=Streptomyces sp. NPDC056112 TaxID=3345715 RepID=UPI0035DC9D51